MFMREIARGVLASAVHKLSTVKTGHRIADSRFAAWICGKGAVVATLRYGAQAVVFVNDYVGRAMYLWGEHDPRITAVIIAAVRSGDTVLDIGANFGVTGLLAAKCVGPTGTVHLFEPQPLVASCLRTSLMINGFSNAVVHQCALSDRPGTAVMTIEDSSNLGMTTLLTSRPDSMNGSRTLRVRIENAGDYVASLECTTVALIKIDVEGYEAIVLESMRQQLLDMRVPVLLFEWHMDERNFHEQKPVRILAKLGYEFFGYDMKPLWHTQLRAVNGEQHPAGHDFVAILWKELDEDRRNSFEALIGRGNA
jgi:FkbM family methyltransferase